MEADNILAYSSVAIVFVIAVYYTVRYSSELASPFTKEVGKKLNKSALPKFYRALTLSLLLLCVYALAITRFLPLILVFVFGNMFFVAIGLAISTLYEPDHRKSQHN